MLFNQHLFSPCCQPLIAIIFPGTHAFVSIQNYFIVFLVKLNTRTIYLGLGEENLLRVVSLLSSLDPRDQTQACRLVAGATSWGPFPAMPAYFPRPPVFGDGSPHCSPDRVHPCITPPDSDFQMLGFWVPAVTQPLSLVQVFKIACMSEIMQHLCLHAWLVSMNKIPPGSFGLSQTADLHPFIPNGILLCVCMYPCVHGSTCHIFCISSCW